MEQLRAQPPAGDPGKRKKVWRTIGLSTVLAVPFWLAMYFFVFSGDGCSKAQGSLTATGLPQAGDLVFTPKVCKSGQHMSFAGVALFTQKNTDAVVTLVKGHLEPAYVLLDPPSCGLACRVRLTPADCSRFVAEVKRTRTTVNDIRLLDGRLALTCALPSGAKIEADVKFESCD